MQEVVICTRAANATTLPAFTSFKEIGNPERTIAVDPIV
jgi:hypothetical protein